MVVHDDSDWSNFRHPSGQLRKIPYIQFWRFLPHDAHSSFQRRPNLEQFRHFGIAMLIGRADPAVFSFALPVDVGRSLPALYIRT
jgi:hypothetical protein